MSEQEIRDKFVKLSAAQLKEFWVDGSLYLMNQFAVLVWKKLLPDITKYGDQRESKGFQAGVEATHEYYGNPSLQPITYTKEQYEAYGDQRELSELENVWDRFDGYYADVPEFCDYLTGRIAELKAKVGNDE